MFGYGVLYAVLDYSFRTWKASMIIWNDYPWNIVYSQLSNIKRTKSQT